MDGSEALEDQDASTIATNSGIRAALPVGATASAAFIRSPKARLWLPSASGGGLATSGPAVPTIATSSWLM